MLYGKKIVNNSDMYSVHITIYHYYVDDVFYIFLFITCI
jgi:hypothetical protein